MFAILQNLSISRTTHIVKHYLFKLTYGPFCVTCRVFDEHPQNTLPRGQFFCFTPSPSSLKYVPHACSYSILELTLKGLYQGIAIHNIKHCLYTTLEIPLN